MSNSGVVVVSGGFDWLVAGYVLCVFFFFSSRRRHTRSLCDWIRRVLFRSQLASWEAEADDDVAATIKSVRQQLLNLNITGRLPVKLDPDFVRVDENSNPPLVGDYTLYTVQRPVTITLLGAVSGAGQLPWQAGRSVTDYLQDHPRLAGADKNNVMVITPEGETVVAPVALWNKRHVEPPPGSQLWLGFSAHVLPEKYADLNDQIVSVLTQRVPD